MKTDSNSKVFEKYASRYDQWFEKYPFVYASELNAIRKSLPHEGKGIEVGIGTGRFAAPLDIPVGVEPSSAMRNIAEQRGLSVVDGFAENLPYQNEIFDFVLMVTTICFVNNPGLAVKEACRILNPQGVLVVGFVDRNSLLGQRYQAHKDGSLFYQNARFFSTGELVALMRDAGLNNFVFRQTLFKDVRKIRATEPVQMGYGDGSFVVIVGQKPSRDIR